MHSSSSSISSDEEEKVETKEADITGLPKLDFKISELSSGQYLTPSVNKKANISTQLSKLTDTKPIGSPKSDRSFEDQYQPDEQEMKEEFMSWTKEEAKAKTKIKGEEQKAYFRMAQIFITENDFVGAITFL